MIGTGSSSGQEPFPPALKYNGTAMHPGSPLLQSNTNHPTATTVNYEPKFAKKTRFEPGEVALQLICSVQNVPKVRACLFDLTPYPNNRG